MPRLACLFLAITLLAACSETPPADAMNGIAKRYVHLVLATGEIAPGYVDAYYGPPEWRETVRNEAADREAVLERAQALREELKAVPMPYGGMPALRRVYLDKQLDALIAYLEILGGKELTFDAEAQALYDVSPPHFDAAHFDAILAEIDALVPGEGSLAERVENFRQQFVIPGDALPAVFEAAIEECRTRTLMHIPMPVQESFRVEYVNDKPWSGYNWFQGDAHSLIQVNTDLPIFIDRAVELGCHEGYPGHHVYNALLESELVDQRGWMEFSVYPLFSPPSLIAEGSANYGVELAFPGDERLAFERDVLAPLAGIDADMLDEYAALREKLAELDYAGNEAARAYLDGEMNRDEAIDWLVKYNLYSPERAAQRVDFIETYRSYVINYNLGRDLVRDYVERNAESHEGRWQVFAELLGSPRLPSGLQAPQDVKGGT
ncbi:MAG TPA: hypothetical protein VF254_06225 [Gammaproteobacteria bacterium]